MSGVVSRHHTITPVCVLVRASMRVLMRMLVSVFMSQLVLVVAFLRQLRRAVCTTFQQIVELHFQDLPSLQVYTLNVNNINIANV